VLLFFVIYNCGPIKNPDSLRQSEAARCRRRGYGKMCHLSAWRGYRQFFILDLKMVRFGALWEEFHVISS